MEMTTFKDLLESVTALQEKNLSLKVEEKIVSLLHKPSIYHSEKLDELFAALAKAQSEMQVANKKHSNPRFPKTMYSKLCDFIEASRPALTKNGLCVVQSLEMQDSGGHVFVTRLGHCNGQWISSRMKFVPDKTDVQGLASHMTYLRRILYAALIGAVDTDDDDGNAACDDPFVKAAKPILQKADDEEPNRYEYVTPEQTEELEMELRDHSELAAEIMSRLRIRSLADMPKEMYHPSLKRIREIKLGQSTIKGPKKG